MGPTHSPIESLRGILRLRVKRLARDVDQSHQMPISRTRGAIPILPLKLLHVANRGYMNLIYFYINDVIRARYNKYITDSCIKHISIGK